MKISTPAARTCKKLLAFVADAFFTKKQYAGCDDDTNAVPAAESNPAAANKPYQPAGRQINDISVGAKLINASFSFIPSSKTSFMKQILLRLHITVNFFTGLVNSFLNTILKGGLLHRKNRSWKMKVVYVNGQHSQALPFDKQTKGNFISHSNSDKNSIIKRFLRKTGIFAIVLLISSLFLASTSFGQKTWDGGAGTSNWGDANNWNPNGVPAATDAVTLINNTTVNVNVNSSCASITFPTNNNNSVTLNVNTGITLNVSGTITIPRSSNGSNTLAVGAGILNAGSLAFTNGGGSPRHQLTISTGTATITGNVTQTGSNGSATITFTGAGLLQLGGTIFTDATGTLSTVTGCTVEYNGSGAQTIGDFAYVNLKLDGGNTKSLQTPTVTFPATVPTSVSGTLTVLQNTTLALLNFGIATPTSVVMDGGATTGATISGTTGLTLGGNVTINDAGTGASGATISAPVALGAARTFTVADDGTSATDLTISGVVSGTGFGLTKAGAGTMVLSGASTYTGTTTISQGILSGGNIVVAGGNSNLGNATTAVVLGSATTSGTLNYTGNTATYTRGFTVSAGGGGITNTTANLLTVATGAIANSGQLTLSNTGSGGTTITSVISGGGSVVINNTGSGVTTYSGTNTYTGTTTISSGVLQLGNTNVISNSSNFILNGGTFKSGATSGFSETLGTLQLSASSTIALGTASHTITFANSNGVPWTSGQTLTITGWTGTPGSSGTAGKIFVGNSATSLTAAQLAQITFTGFPGSPTLLSSGELVPAAQNPILAITGTTNNGTSCIGVAATSQTYTITNTGGTASGVTVVSNNPQFVVSALSSTTIAGSGGTATYKVTFTPSSSGAQSATITVSSTTTGSNSPTSTPTGNGNALPQGSLSGNTICSGGTGQLTFTSTSGTGPFTLIINGVTYSGVVSGTPFNTNSNPSVTTNYTLTSITDANSCGLTTGITGASATITVNTPPVITGNLAVSPNLACAGTNSTTFTVNASGTGLTYQWQRGIGGVYTNITGATTPNDGATYSGFNSAVLTVANAPLSMNGYTYQCVVTGTCSPAATSNAPAFHVLAIPTVTSIVGNGTICLNTPTNYTATHSGGTGLWSIVNGTGAATIATNGDGSATVSATVPGTVTISYAFSGFCGNASQSLTITVDPNAAITSVTGITNPVCIGTTNLFTANGVVLGTNGAGAWSSDNTSVATVDGSGNVTAVSAGTANIIYTITGGCNGTPTAEQVITVNPDAAITSVTGITSPVCIGTTNLFTANGVVLGSNGSGAWSSDNTSVATVDGSGNVTAVSAGTANIIYTITGGCNGTPTAEQVITVNPNAAITSVTGITTPVCIGTTNLFTANGVVLGSNGSGAWSSDNTSVATVDGSGNVTAVSNGTANIIYTITGGCNGTPTAEQVITVNPNASITSVTGITSPVCIGTTNLFTANGVVLGSNGSGAWSSDNTSVATVDASGNVTAVSAGTANIIYTITGGCNGTPTAEQAITVDPNAAITSVTGITSPVCIGTTNLFTANGVVLGSNGSGAWSSDNTSVAIVDGSGNVTAVSAGTANIIYTITGGCNGTPTAEQVITVNPDAAITSVTGITSPVCIGTTNLFTANGVVLGSNGSGAWSSDNTSVATVDGSGNVTAVSAGTANIIYTITGGCNGTPTAEQVITVNPNAAITSVTGITTPVCIGTTNLFTANGVVLGSNGSGAWSSDNTSVATVDASGNVTAVSAGTANIIYTITGGCNGTPTAEQAITVNPDAAITSVTGGQTPICIGNVTTVTANGVVLGSNGIGTWSSDNTSVATVDGSGNVTAIGPGTANIIYTITGGCNGTPVASQSITVNDNATIGLSSATGTDGQTVCINNNINNITYSVGGGATSASVAGLPAGVTWTYSSGTVTITGAPTVSGSFTYTVTTVGPCDIPTATGTIFVNANSSIDLSSANETAAQTVCINNAITPIVYAIDNGGTGGGVTGLPNGVTGTYSGGLFTITGTPTQAGTFTYTVTTTGPCQQVSLGGTITVNDNSTIMLSTAGTDGQTVCINHAINDINYTVGGGATGASITSGALPNGVTGSFNGGVFTITGTPTESGNFSYTATTAGPCNNVSLSGTITVNANSTINLSSATGTNAQTVCINNAITSITYAVGGGGTSASITSGTLPTGVTGAFNAGVFTISGTPTQSGTFSYTVTTAGPCTNVSLSGTITVNPDATISLSSGPATQTVCINTGIIPVTYTMGGSATNISITAGALPAGVTGSFSGGVFTISGTPTQSGIFNYTVTTAGPCTNPSVNGTITVNPTPVVNAVSNASYCNNSAGSAISFSTSTPGTATYNWSSSANVGFGTNGTGNIPSFTAINNSNSVVTATVSVTATINGCPGTPTTFNITVNPSPVVSPVSNLNYCNNGAGAGVSFSSPITGGTVNYTWTSSVNVGFGLNGNGSIGSFTAINNSFAPLVATVTVTPSLNGCSGTPITFTVTVNPNANSGTISGSSTLCTGTNAQLSTNGNAGGTWTSSTPSIATVDPVSGLVTAGSTTGSATIFYTVNNICGSSSSSFTVSVNPTATAGTISGPTVVCAGSSVLLSTNGNSGGNWFSSNTSAATVNASGFVTGVSAGSATIYYYVVNSCGTSISAGYTVNISAGGNPGTIIGSSSICAGSATLLLTTGSSGGTWASTNPSVAIIDGTSGFVIAQNAGTTTITYTVPSNSCSSGSQVAYFTLTVNPAGNAGTISGNSNICAGTSTSLTTTGSSGGTWLSGNTLVATVDPNTGLVTGVAPGAVTITYHISNSCGTANATFPINVSPGAVAGTISGSSSVCVGSAISLTSSGTPGGSWTSSNTAAAQVDGNGVVLGTGAGNTTITYTVTSLCSSSSISTTISVTSLPNAGTVSGSATICAGLAATFTSTGNTGGVWSSSNTAAATVNAASGVVTAVAAGSSTITYTVSGVCGTSSASAPVTINPVLNAGTISGGSSVCVGSALNLSSNGNSGGAWSSSNTSVATVNGSGIVTSVASGNTTITYTVSNSCGTSNTTQLVTVNAIANAGTITGAASVCAGLATTFTSNGNAGGSWSSSNTAVATVNPATGVVTGVAAGSATITYTVTTGCGTASASAGITVNPSPSAGTISGPTAVCVNSSINLTSQIAGGTWSSNSPTVATVNSSGKVTGVSGGSATITYTISTICGTNVATFTVNVNPVPNAGNADGVNSQGSVCVGSSFFMTVTGADMGGIWKSSNPARATVDPNTGEVTGVSAGNTTITYNVTNSCGSSSSGMVVFVNSLPNAGAISGLTSVCTSASINLSASGDAGGTWSSNAPGVATVDPNTGVVTGVAQGTTTIIYTVGSAAVCGTSSATYTVTVNPLAISGTISGNTIVCTGLSTTLTSNGAVGGTWVSSNPAVASVNSTSGVVIGVAAGSAVINYTVTNICGSTTASATVTVNGAPNPGTISGATSVCVGSTINLSDNVSGGTWSSSTLSVATVGANTGIVSGVAAGNTTITYTVTNSCGTNSTTYAVTVNPVPAAATLSGTTYLCTGSTTTLSSNMTGGSWSSSNTAAATVNPATGLVTGISAGTTSISYTISSGCGSATSSVVVTIGNSPSGGTVSGASTLCVGSTAIFTSNGTGGGSWSSNNTAAATVDPATGIVTGVSAGSATISYTVTSTCGSAVSSSNITISALPNAGVVSGSSAICAGSVTTLTSNGTGGGSWSSNNNLVATVNSATGVVTGVAAGSATITYTVTNTCGIATATENITINPLPNSGVVSGAGTLCSGITTAFTSTGNGGGSWSSSNTAVATVDAVTGAVTGVAAGSATISYTVTSATCGSSVSSANITINPAPDPGTISGLSAVCAGSAITLTSDGIINGIWSSGNNAVATVDNNGKVTGVAAGSTTITYTVTNGCGTAGATKVITINPLANAGTVSGAATLCAGGATTTFTSNGLSGGTWSSDNTSVATVDAASGLVTGVSAGNANITYSITTPCGTSINSAPITIIILPNAGTVSGSSAVCVGSTTNYTSNGLTGGTWSSLTPSVATVDAATGVVTGVSAGNATITYTFTNSCGTNSASQTITVNPLANAGTVSGAANVCIGAQATFTSNGLSGGTWSSSNTAAATVDPNTGVVNGIVAGNATITYTSTTPCGTTTASSGITVVAIPDAGTVSGSTTVCVGANTTYTSSGMSGGTWSSVTPSVATVDAITGIVTGVSAGNATIIYTFTNSCGSPSASQMITVNPLPNAGTVSGASTVCIGSQATFTSSGLSGGTWSTSDATIASVNPSTGVVIGVGTGSAMITYTSTTPCGTLTASANIAVNPVLNAGTVSGSSTLCIGSTTPYTSNGSAGGTWSSVTPSVATVNATTGVVTGVSTGNATITYTVSSGCGTFSSTKMIAVSPAANTGTISGPSSVCTGSSVNFTRSGGSGSGTWSSSNTSVATVNSSGRVTGLAPGTAIISYSVASSCGIGSATSSITVNSSLTLNATNVNASTDPTSCSATVTLGSNVTTTGSPTLQYRIGFWPFFSFPISATHTFYRGTTPVVVIASNSCGSVARMFLVTVTDNTPPAISCKPDASRTTDGGTGKYSVRGHEFDATATDGCGVASLVYSLSGATVDGFERNNTSLNNVKLNIGTTTITWKATDVNGNVSTCSTNITVTGNLGHYFGREDESAPSLQVKVAPNPTSNYFTLKFLSDNPANINIVVVDVMGRTVEEVREILPNSTLQIGGSYHPGIYIVQAVQGSDAVSLKLIKEGN